MATNHNPIRSSGIAPSRRCNEPQVGTEQAQRNPERIGGKASSNPHKLSQLRLSLGITRTRVRC
jgi:hypothetical protein